MRTLTYNVNLSHKKLKIIIINDNHIAKVRKKPIKISSCKLWAIMSVLRKKKKKKIVIGKVFPKTLENLKKSFICKM